MASRRKEWLRAENERLRVARLRRLTWWRSLTPLQQHEYQAQKEAERAVEALDEEFRAIVS